MKTRSRMCLVAMLPAVMSSRSLAVDLQLVKAELCNGSGAGTGILLLPSTTSQPSIETQGYGARFHVDFATVEANPDKGSYDGFIGPHTRLFIQPDASLFVESGWVYVERTVDYHARDAKMMTTQPDRGPCHEEWVATSRATAGAEGSKLLVWAPGNQPSDVHHVVFLEGSSSTATARIYTVAGALMKWPSTQEYKAIQITHSQLDVATKNVANSTTDATIRSFLDAARAAGFSIPKW